LVETTESRTRKPKLNNLDISSGNIKGVSMSVLLTKSDEKGS
jgi:hypothetical protein